MIGNANPTLNPCDTISSRFTDQLLHHGHVAVLFVSMPVLLCVGYKQPRSLTAGMVHGAGAMPPRSAR
jgi:hypothetical protein